MEGIPKKNDNCLWASGPSGTKKTAHEYVGYDRLAASEKRRSWPPCIGHWSPCSASSCLLKNSKAKPGWGSKEIKVYDECTALISGLPSARIAPGIQGLSGGAIRLFTTRWNCSTLSIKLACVCIIGSLS
jgi:hypothetical protein